MNKVINVNDLPEFDIAQHLQTDADVAEYLCQVLEEGDSSELAAALGHIAKSLGKTEIAKATGIKREALYKALRPNSQPRLDTNKRVSKHSGLN